jgi:hypothetical protein
MADKESHARQARHNSAFLDLIKASATGEEYPDWYVTVSFYAAVHFVEAAVAGAEFLFIETSPGTPRRKIRGPGHSEVLMPQLSTTSPHVVRKKLLQWNGLYFPGCYEPYSDLLEMSHAARYSAQQVHPSQAKEAKECLEKIQANLAARIS